jgi:hypothetical protein
VPLAVALAIEDLHAVVAAISDCHLPRRAQHRDAAWVVELAVALAVCACAGEDADKSAVKLEL